MTAGKMHAGDGSERRRPACTRRQNPRRQRGDGQSGVTAERKMHAGDGRKVEASVQRRQNPAGSIETAKPEEKWKENARRGVEERQGRTCTWEGNCPPASSKRPSRRRNGKKMHAGEARNSRDQRAHAGKFLAGIVETAKLAEKQHENARR
ncbi:MAG: hypothetical protein ACLTDS_03085 [Bianqueaceae bacterium]